MTDTQKPKIPITRDQAAERAGVRVRTIDYWRNTGKVTNYKDGRGNVWLDADEIDDLTEIKKVSA
jgi:hypothetical protein